MSKIARFPASIPASKARSSQSASDGLVWIALFSGIGLLVSLIAVLLGAQLAWY